MTKRRKSEFDLSEFAILKVPLEQYNVLKPLADGMKIHWSEVARRILRLWISNDGKVVE